MHWRTLTTRVRAVLIATVLVTVTFQAVWSEDAAVTNIERCAVQRAHQARRAQPPLAQPRVGMSADVIGGEHTLTRVADHELAAADYAGPHAADRKLCELHPRGKLRHGGLTN